MILQLLVVHLVASGNLTLPALHQVAAHARLGTSQGGTPINVRPITNELVSALGALGNYG